MLRGIYTGNIYKECVPMLRGSGASKGHPMWPTCFQDPAHFPLIVPPALLPV